MANNIILFILFFILKNYCKAFLYTISIFFTTVMIEFKCVIFVLQYFKNLSIISYSRTQKRARTKYFLLIFSWKQFTEIR